MWRIPHFLSSLSITSHPPVQHCDYTDVFFCLKDINLSHLLFANVQPDRTNGKENFRETKTQVERHRLCIYFLIPENQRRLALPMAGAGKVSLLSPSAARPEAQRGQGWWAPGRVPPSGARPLLQPHRGPASALLRRTRSGPRRWNTQGK